MHVGRADRNTFAMNMNQLNTVVSFIMWSLHEVYKLNVFWEAYFKFKNTEEISVELTALIITEIGRTNLSPLCVL
jgi:hypothetical protein